MSVVKGRFIDESTPIKSSSDPVAGEDLARKSYVDSAAAAAAAGKLDASAVGLTVAELDGSGKVPSSQLPAYVDDVLEYADLVAFPATGESAKIYIALDTGKTYRWSGSVYVEIIASPGTTDAIAEGSVNLYYTDLRASAAAPVQSVAGKTGAVSLDKSDVGLGSVDNTSDADKPISTLQQAALDDKLALSGGTMTGAIDMGGSSLSNLPSPLSDDEAATKKYVDDGLLLKLDASEKGAVNGVAELGADGKIPSSQLPAIAITDTFVVASESSMLALTAEKGDVAVRTDLNKSFILLGSDPAVLADWQELLTPTDAVQSVNGQTGAVSLDSDDVSEGSTNLYYTTARSALKQDSLGTGTTSQFLRGDLSWQEVPTSVGIAQTKVVSKGGDDVTGDGTLTKPFATIAAAMASITDASPTKRYMVKVQAGAYTEGALALKANVFIVGDLKEAVRITASSVDMAADFTGSADNRSGIARVILTGACNFDWSTVTSAAGKLYFTEVSFNSAMTMYGHNNATAQAQFDSCQFYSSLTISGINVGVFTNNYSFGSITLNQHPNGGMATILATAGGQCSGTVTLNATVSDFNRRCSLFAKNFMMNAITVNGASAYADVTDSSLPSAGPTITNGGNVVYLNPVMANRALSNLSYPTAVNQPILPATTSATNLGDWGKQWMFIMGYVHASSGTDLYLTSVMQNYDPAGDSAGRAIYIQADGYGLQTNVNGGNIELETAAVSGTGVRGKVQIKARELDMTTAKITNLADATNASDAVTLGQVQGSLATWAKATFTLSAQNITDGYIDLADLAKANSTILKSGGVVHEEGAAESYTVSTVSTVSRITFLNDLASGSTALIAGDKVYVQYQK
jgi:hypothetical protein